jgi:hypothetical protein
MRLNAWAWLEVWLIFMADVGVSGYAYRERRRCCQASQVWIVIAFNNQVAG